MLRLLLDEHLSPRIATGLRRRSASVAVFSMQEWERGAFLGRRDDQLLMEAARQRLTLATYDRRTIPILLKGWREQGRSHGGIIFIDEKTVPLGDVGGLVRALAALFREFGDLDWTDREEYLRR
ncbi:MAG TPA: hypothetical protein VJS11_12515 [Acidobacteriaceae bacterium]|nr:hypothetical protein [Acidobacteriaceae bacterium]